MINTPQQGNSVDSESNLFVRDDSNDMDTEELTVVEPVNDDDEPEVILRETGISCLPEKVFETVQKRCAFSFEEIAGLMPPTSVLRDQLEEAAGFARTAPKTDFKRHKAMWVKYVKNAERRARANKDKSEKLAEEIEKFDMPGWSKAFERTILKYACKVHTEIEANQKFIDNLLKDLKAWNANNA